MRPIFSISGTTGEYSETSIYVTLPSSMLFLCCYKTWHQYLHFAETLAAICSSTFLGFLTDFTLSTIKFNVFNKWHIYCILGPLLNFITNCNFAQCQTIVLDKQTNTGTFTEFGLIHAGNYATFLRKTGN